jgi:glutamine cyclotransferase
MGAVIEVKYFNTFILKKTISDDEPIWNGSFGVPQDLGGYKVVAGNGETADYAIEESRIRGGYNNTTVDFGVKAYIVEDERVGSYRKSSLIYSGIFNSRTGINQTNVFSVGEDITKTADPANASIQKLYAADTNLIIFQELKVSRALIDKDAIYNAEGGGAVTASNLVIGVIQPYAGEFGISKNPESFASYGYQKYFSDQNNGAMLRLSLNGIEEISVYGMRDFFKDDLNRISTSSGKAIGAYDIHNNQYVISLQENASSTYNTLSFDEQAKGWVSFFSFEPEQMFSIKNNFYTVKSGEIWEHYANPIEHPSAKRGNFYNSNYPSTVTVAFNAAPANSKTFKTISYEGANGWKLTSLISDPTGADTSPAITWSSSNDLTNLTTATSQFPSLYSYYEGEYIDVQSTGTVSQVISTTQFLITALKEPLNNSNIFGTNVPISTAVSNITGVAGYVTVTNNNTVNTVISGVTQVIPPGTLISAPQAIIPSGTFVVSYNNATGALVTNNALTINAGYQLVFVNFYMLTTSVAAPNVAVNAVLTFSSTTSRADYLSVFNTENPAYPALHAGFDRKENKYVGNLRNFTPASNGEVIWGRSISGIKGFYALGTFSTDTTTEPGSEKQLFSVESSYIMNNGY